MSTDPVGILTVDDNAETRYVLGHMLRLRGYAREEARYGVAALDYFPQGGRACPIILDMTMPGMSGDEVRKALKGTP